MTDNKKKQTTKGRRKEPSNEKLDEMIEEAIVDAYDESEQTLGFYTMLEENPAMPFKTQVRKEVPGAPAACDKSGLGGTLGTTKVVSEVLCT